MLDQACGLQRTSHTSSLSGALMGGRLSRSDAGGFPQDEGRQSPSLASNRPDVLHGT